MTGQETAETTTYQVSNVSARAYLIGVSLFIFTPVLYVLAIAITGLNGILLIGIPFIWLGIYYLHKKRLTQRIAITFTTGAMNVRYLSQLHLIRRKIRSYALPMLFRIK